jgi:hypothetical protein
VVVDRAADGLVADPVSGLLFAACHGMLPGPASVDPPATAVAEPAEFLDVDVDQLPGRKRS